MNPVGELLVILAPSRRDKQTTMDDFEIYLKTTVRSSLSQGVNGYKMIDASGYHSSVFDSTEQFADGTLPSARQSQLGFSAVITTRSRRKLNPISDDSTVGSEPDRKSIFITN